MNDPKLCKPERLLLSSLKPGEMRTIPEIMQATGLSHAGASGIAKRLTERGLLQRRASRHARKGSVGKFPYLYGLAPGRYGLPVSTGTSTRKDSSA